MKKHPLILHVELLDLLPKQVMHRYCFFRSELVNPDKIIRSTFKALKDRVGRFGLDPGTLLHIGIPDMVDDQVIGYDCCIEFPLPEDEEAVSMLPGGYYAVLVIQKRPELIVPAIRSFRSEYLPAHGLIPDEDRPIYEIYYQDTMEYCVPIR